VIIYGSILSPFVRKTIAAANEKGIAFDLKQVGIGSTDEGFLAASPFRKIPALTDGDFSVSDSSAIIAYLDALKPDPALIPADARARATTIWFDEFADTIMTPVMGAMFFNRVVAPKFLGKAGDLAAADKAEVDDLPTLLAYLERAIPDSGFLVGGALTLADLAVASPFVNLEHTGYRLDAAQWPRTTKYVANILARPSFARMIASERKMLAA
jgi:glutathione S-transferase